MCGSPSVLLAGHLHLFVEAIPLVQIVDGRNDNRDRDGANNHQKDHLTKRLHSCADVLVNKRGEETKTIPQRREHQPSDEQQLQEALGELNKRPSREELLLEG